MTAPKYKPYSVDAYNTLDVRRIVDVCEGDAFVHDKKSIVGTLIIPDQDNFGKWTDGTEYCGCLIIRGNVCTYKPGDTTSFYKIKTKPFMRRIC